VWHKTWRLWRNRTLSDPRFIAFAERMPFMRPIARKRAKSLFDLVAGGAYAQTLYACVELKLIEKVGLGEATVEQVAEAIGWTTSNTERLIKAGTALDLFERDGEVIVLGQQGAALLAQPWIMRFVAHHRHFAEDLLDPVALLSGQLSDTAMKRYWDYENAQADRTDYSALMAASQEAVSRQILAAYDFSAHRHVLDIGGGTGAFLRAIGSRYPQLQRSLADLPAVAELARADPLNAGIEVWGGDIRREVLPQGADVVTLIRVVHDHDDAQVLSILDAIRRHCGQNFMLLVAEPFAGNPATAGVTDAYFNLYFAAMGQGRTRSPAEIAALAKKAGFVRWQVRPTRMPIITGLLQLFPS
jgi:demethylspheroidene O-methyltransferase